MQSSIGERRGIAVNSNWITTVGMALLFVCITFLLAWNIREFLLNRLDHEPSIYVLGFNAAYALLAAIVFQPKSVKAALLLLAVTYVVRIVLHYQHPDLNLRHTALVICSILKQVAYTVVLFAMAKWFKSVIQTEAARDSRSDDAAQLP